MEEIRNRLDAPIVREQLSLLKFRNRFPAFCWDAAIDVSDSNDGRLSISWEMAGHRAVLDADLTTFDFTISSWSDGVATPVFASNP